MSENKQVINIDVTSSNADLYSRGSENLGEKRKLKVQLPRENMSYCWIKVSIGFFVALLLSSFIFDIDQFVKAQGKSIPSGRVKQIQHLEGGIVSTVHVMDGQKVKKGDPLVTIDLGSIGMNADELSNRMGVFKIQKKRLLAELYGTDLVYDSEEKAEYAESVRIEYATFQARKSELNSRREVNSTQTSQTDSRVQEAQARLSGLEMRLVTAKRQLQINEKLRERKSISEMDYLASLREFEQISSEINAARSNLSALQGSTRESRARYEEDKSQYQRRAADELASLEAKISSLSEELERAKKQQERRIISSPVDGFVNNLKVTNEGAVIKAAEVLMQIVPDEKDLLLETYVSASNVGLISQSMSAEIQISAFDFIRYGQIKGEVISISPDSSGKEQEEPKYKVMIRAEKNHMGEDPSKNRIIPGMTVNANIKVGQQSIAGYIFSPFIRTAASAFTEPNR